MTNIMNPTTQEEPANGPELSQEPVHFTVQVGQMAQGGHCIAQHDGRVVFVRHAIPGETVIAQRTGVGPSGRFWLADTVEVLNASEFRRAHQWKLADSQRAYGAGRQPLSGAEYGHIVVEHQRRLKATVFRDTMVRLGGQSLEDMEISVVGMEGDGATGLHWRTRNAFTVSAAGRLSLPVYRSLNSVAVRNLPLAVSQLDALELWHLDFSGAARVEIATPTHGGEALIAITPKPQVTSSEPALQEHINSWRREVSRLPEHVSAIVSTPLKKRSRKRKVTLLQGHSWVHEEVASDTRGVYSFRVSTDTRWPAHRDGPVTLVDAVLQAADVQPGQVIADLYAGSGLYSRFLAAAVGPDGTVLSVEPRECASQDASFNLRDVSQATVLHGKVNGVMTGWLRTPDAAYASGGLNGTSVDTVVLNAPRKGARSATLSRIHQLDPGKIVYISSDPAALARETSWLNQRGWVLASVDAYDLAPETPNLDSIVVFRKP